VATEAATLATVLLVSVYRTAASLEAAWKYFILCGVGIAQALFGTILLYFAAERVLGAAGNALLWTHLVDVKGQLEPTIMALSFIFLLVGYGTKVGLAPLHNWLPDAHAEGPTPISAVLSGLLLNVALYAVVRNKVLVDGALGTHAAGNLMMGFGLLSVIVAAFFLSRQKDIKRLFAYSSIEHMITFERYGRKVASLWAAVHDRAFADQVGDILRGRPCSAEGRHAADGPDPRADPRQPDGRLGADAGLARDPRHAAVRRVRERVPDPDHGVHEYPWTTPILLIALGIAFAAIFGKMQPIVFGETTAKPLPHPPALVPVFVHLLLVLMLGLYMPPYLADWYRQAAALLG
jgi:hydrogenase-4 component F